MSLTKIYEYETVEEVIEFPPIGTHTVTVKGPNGWPVVRVEVQENQVAELEAWLEQALGDSGEVFRVN